MPSRHCHQRCCYRNVFTALCNLHFNQEQNGILWYHNQTKIRFQHWTKHIICLKTDNPDIKQHELHISENGKQSLNRKCEFGYCCWYGSGGSGWIRRWVRMSAENGETCVAESRFDYAGVGDWRYGAFSVDLCTDHISFFFFVFSESPLVEVVDGVNGGVVFFAVGSESRSEALW